MQPWHSIVARGHTALVLVRHGRTAYNREGRFLGRTDVPLDAEGVRQAGELAPWRGMFEQVVSSPLARARMTAEVLADDLTFDEALMELDQGELEGRKVEEALADHPSFFAAWAEDPGSVRVPGGGRLDALRDGAMASLVGWAGRHPAGPIAIVSHQLVLASVLATLDDAELAQWRAYALPNAGVAMLSFDGSALRLEARFLDAPTP